jgi:hypothetical protein
MCAVPLTVAIFRSPGLKRNFDDVSIYPNTLGSGVFYFVAILYLCYGSYYKF